MHFHGEVLALCTAVSWSITPYIFAQAARKVGGIQLNVDRLIFASIFLLLVLLIFNIPHEANTKQIGYMVLSGVIGLIFGDHFLYKSYNRIGPRYTALIMSLSPAIASFMAWVIYGETLLKTSIIGIAITIAGIVFVVNDKPQEDGKIKHKAKDYIFGFLGATGQAGGIVVAKMAFLEGGLHGIFATFIRIFTSAIMLSIFMNVCKRYNNPIKLYKKDAKPLFLIISGTILGPCIGIALSLTTIQYIPVGIASTIFATSPILMLPISYFLYNDKFSIKTIIGVIIAIIGVSFLFIF